MNIPIKKSVSSIFLQSIKSTTSKLILCCLALSACQHHNHSNLKALAAISNYENKAVLDCGKKKVVLVGGCFDVLHYGHFEYLRKAKLEGQYLIVALEPDERIIKYKNRQPIHNQKQRAANLSAISFVDHVLLLPELKSYKDYLNLVINTCPNVIAVTAGDPQLENIQKQAARVGATVKEVNNLETGVSSSDIIQKMGN